MIKDTLLPEFDHECATTRKVLANIPAGKFEWRPHEKSYTMGALATHLCEILGWGVATMERDGFDGVKDGASMPRLKVNTVEELLAAFDDMSAKARAAIASASDEEFAKPWTLSNDGKVIFTMPKIATFRAFVLSHSIHHRGAFSVYLRLTGAPVPSIYGPSADDKGGM